MSESREIAENICIWRDCSDFSRRFKVVDETWTHHYPKLHTSETKEQSKQCNVTQ